MLGLVLQSLGAILIFLSSVGIGIGYSLGFQERIRQNRELHYLFNSLQNEISFLRNRIVDAFTSIASQSNSVVKYIFSETADKMRNKPGQDFEKIWKCAIERNRARLAFEKQEYEILRMLGSTLGKTEIESQIRSIELARSQLKQLETDILERMKKYSTLAKHLGVLGGVFVIIILL